MATTKVTTGGITDATIATADIADQAITLDKLPHGTSSNDGKFLRANNGADPSFETVSIPAGTTINGNTDHRVITATGTANTLQGESGLTFDGTTLTVAGASNATQAIFSGTGGSGARGLEIKTESGGATDEVVIIKTRASGTTGAIKFQTNGANSLWLDGNGGDVTVKGGNLKFGIGGKGIDFSATGDGTGVSSMSELLDDYECGEWTGSINSGTANINNPWYVKVGKLVIGGGSITAISDTSSSNAIIVSGLPFTNSGGFSGSGAVSASKNNKFGEMVRCYVSGTDVRFITSSLSTGSNDYLRHSSMVQSTGSITFGFNYRTA